MTTPQPEPLSIPVQLLNVPPHTQVPVVDIPSVNVIKLIELNDRADSALTKTLTYTGVLKLYANYLERQLAVSDTENLAMRKKLSQIKKILVLHGNK